MSDPTFNLVAVAYEAHIETRRFLESMQHAELPFTLLVIDNNTPSGLTQQALAEGIDAVRSLDNCLSAEVIYNDDNVGYAKACNHGASLGSAPYIGLLNCDIAMRPGVLTRLRDSFEEDDSIGVLGPRTKDSRGKLTHAGIVPGPQGFQHRFWQKPDQAQALDFFDVPTVSGATYFVRRSMWEQLTDCDDYREIAPYAEGAFLPTQHYFEETFCSLHARAHGWRVMYEGRVAMIHEWNRSSPGNTASVYWNDSKQYFLSACAIHGIEETGT